jgi:hypothetical protein
MSEPPPSNDMEKKDDATRIEYSENPSDEEGQNEIEEQDKVNALEELDYSPGNYRNADQIEDDLYQSNGTRSHGFPLDWISDSSLPLWCSASIQYVVYLSQVRNQIFNGIQFTEILEVLIAGHGSFWVTFSL